MSEMSNIDVLRKQNAERLAALYEAGITIDPIVVLKARVDLVTEVVLKAIGIDDSMIESDWELLVEDLLNRAYAELSARDGDNENPE